MFTEQIDIDSLCAQAEALCCRIAPKDLGDTPLYIVPQSRLPDHLGGKSICDGFTTPSLDLYLKAVIGPAFAVPRDGAIPRKPRYILRFSGTAEYGPRRIHAGAWQCGSS